MKKTYSYIIALVLSFITLQQAYPQSDEAIYVYRNDGDFNAFFNNDIDSIVYSRIGLDSVEYKDYVIQEVWTQDSVYRIPLTAIDSIGFQKPEIILQKNVVKMAEKGIISYLEKVDGMTLTFSSSMPENLRPKYGDILTDFTSPLLEDGFVGKVDKCQSLSSGYVVTCDSVYDIKEIFSRCIGIERLTTNSSNKVKSLSTEDTWNDCIPVPINVGTSFGIGSTGNISLSGNLNGMIAGTVVYNTDTECYHVILKHRWVPSITLNVKAEGSFDEKGKKEKIIDIKFPISMPVMAYNLDFNLFCRGNMKAELNVEAKWPALEYITGFTVMDNQIGNFKNAQTKVSGEEFSPQITSSLEISGDIQVGACITNYIGYAGYLGVRAGGFADLYLGPKLSGNLSIDMNSFANKDYYSAIKDSKIEFNPLAADVDFYMGVYRFGKEDPTNKKNIPIPTYLKIWEGYIFPEFSDLTIRKNNAERKADIYSDPSRNLIMPLTLGFGLYDKDGNLINSEYDKNTYKVEDEYAMLNHSFTDLALNKEYTAKPLIRLDLGGNSYDIAATPEETFMLECSATTGESSDIKAESAVCYGHVDLPDEYNALSYGIVYSSTTTSPTLENSVAVQATSTSDGDFSVTLSGLEGETTYYYRAYIAVDGNYYYGETMSFKTDKKIEEIVNLGLSVKWRGWNLGADVPEGYGKYYAWGETTDKGNYTWDTYFDNPNGSDGEWKGCSVTSDIAGSEYDAASVELGSTWRLPTEDEMQELVDKCEWEWSEMNGVKGYKVTGPNGNYIFLPAAGNADGYNITNTGAYGGYWTSTPNNDNSKAMAKNLYFYGSSSTKLYNTQWSNRYSGRSIRPVTP